MESQPENTNNAPREMSGAQDGNAELPVASDDVNQPEPLTVGDRFQCEQCSSSYSRLDSLIIHRRFHNRKAKVSDAHRYAQLTKHERVKSSPRAVFKRCKPTQSKHGHYSCEKCHAKFLTMNDLMHHLSKHSSDVAYKCTQCSKQFIRKGHLKIHKRFHTDPELKPYQCRHCSASFVYQASLERHGVLHTILGELKSKVCAAEGQLDGDVKGESLHKCDHCPTAFIDYDELERHKLQSHQVDKPANELSLPKLLDSEPSVTSHNPKRSSMERKLPEANRSTASTKCRYCGKRYKDPSGLLRHIDTHTGIKPYKCDECPAAFHRKDYLVTHNKAHEPVEARCHKCPHCSASYFTENRLSEHVLVHSKNNDANPELTAEKAMSGVPDDLGSSISYANRSVLRSPAGSTSSASSSLPKAYKCQICSAAFRLAAGLTDHMRTHARERIHRCDECPMRFNRKEHLKRHIRRVHIVQKPFQCDKCSASFSDDSSLSKHKVRVHNQTSAMNDSRVKRSDGNATQSEKIDDVKPGPKDHGFRCDKCPVLFNDRYAMERHKQAHVKKLPYKCNMCTASFDTSQSCSNHKRIHSRHSQHTEDSQTTQKLKCEICSATFSRPFKLKLHKLTHKNRTLVCDYCPTVLANRGSYLKHKKVHSANKAFKCNKCTASFGTQSNLTVHKQCHSQQQVNKLKLKSSSRAENSPSKGHRCKECRKVFSKLSNLKSHQLVHTIVKQHKCRECPASFHRKSGLIKHERVHQIERPFKCHLCSASYLQSCRLSDHMAVHSRASTQELILKEKIKKSSEEVDQVRHACDKCPATFRQRKNLLAHKLIHLNRRKFRCKICSASFNHTSPLAKHMKLHVENSNFILSTEDIAQTTNCQTRSTNRLPKSASSMASEVYKCSHCPAKYQRRDYLLKHLRAHKGNGNYKCDQCSAAYHRRDNYASHMALHSDEVTRRKSPSSEKPKIEESRRRFPCTLCPTVFNHPKNLRRHQKVHLFKQKYRCDECTATYKNNSALQRHLKVHVELPSTDHVPVPHLSVTGSRTCQFCSHKFQTNCSLRVHERLHTGVKPYKCLKCPAAFHRKSYLTIHERAHDERRSHQCPHCTASYTYGKLLTEHMVVHSVTKSAKLMVYDEKISLKDVTHPSVSTTEPPSTNKCRFCQKVLSSRHTVVSHERLHTGEKPFQCNKCPSAFHREDYLVTHNRAHKEKRTHQCPHCSASYHRNYHLSDHMLVHSEGNMERKPQVQGGTSSDNNEHGEKESTTPSTDANKTCRLCFKIFSSLGNLKIHERLHAEEKPYQCKNCPAAFQHSVYLLKHQRYHGAENPFKCPHCSASYLSQHGLSAHILVHPSDPSPAKQSANSDKPSASCPTRHNGAATASAQKKIRPRNDICSLCPAAYKDKRSLLRHQRAHDSGRPFQCEFCSCSYQHEYVLQKHMHVHTLAETSKVTSFRNETHPPNVETEMLIKQEPQEPIDDPLSSYTQQANPNVHVTQKSTKTSLTLHSDHMDFTSLNIAQLVSSGKKCFIAVYDEEEWKTAGSISIVNTMKRHLPDLSYIHNNHVNHAQVPEVRRSSSLSVASLDRPDRTPEKNLSTPDDASDIEHTTILTALETPQFTLQASVLNSAEEEPAKDSKRAYRISLDGGRICEISTDDGSHEVKTPKLPITSRKTTAYDDLVETSDNHTTVHKRVETTPYDDLFGSNNPTTETHQSGKIIDVSDYGLPSHLEDKCSPIKREPVISKTADVSTKPLINGNFKPLTMENELSSHSDGAKEAPIVDVEALSDCESETSDWSVIDVSDLTPKMVAGLSMTPKVMLPRMDIPVPIEATRNQSDAWGSDAYTVPYDHCSVMSEEDQDGSEQDGHPSAVKQTEKQSHCASTSSQTSETNAKVKTIFDNNEKNTEPARNNGQTMTTESLLTGVDLKIGEVATVAIVVPPVPDASLTLSAINGPVSPANPESPVITDGKFAAQDFQALPTAQPATSLDASQRSNLVPDQLITKVHNVERVQIQPSFPDFDLDEAPVLQQ